MVAARSPSPNSSRPSNPNPNTLRKSGTFNLSNSCSGSEIPQRNSSSKPTSKRPSPRSSFEQKENQRDPKYSKPARSRSPAINPSKGMRSFMAPTISTSSKITAASPKKQILAERNQVVRGNMENNIVSSEGVEGEEIRQKPETNFEEILGRSRSRKLNFCSSKGHYQSADNHYLDAGELDAVPSLPPYDPTKNYLSPRPRFLHFKPNHRIEQHHEFIEDFLYVGEGRRLEDSFSDSEGSGDCSEQSSPMKEPIDDNLMKTQQAQVPDENHVCEQSSSMKPVDDNLMKTQQAQVPDENHVSESKPRPETYKPNSRSCGRFKLIQFLLVLSVLLFSVPLTDSPNLSPFNMKDLSLAGPLTMPFRVLKDINLYDYLEVASKNLQGLAIRMRQWAINSIEIVMSSGSFSKEELDMFHFFNTTLPSSMVQSAGLDFCRRSDLELGEREHNIINRQNDMEMEFELAKTDGEALPGNDGDVAEKLKVKFSEDVNGDSIELVEWTMEENYNPKYDRLNSFTDPAVQFGTINNSKELVEWTMEDNCNPKYDRLNSFTDPAVQFGTINNSDQLEKIEITIFEEVGGEGYSVGFDIAKKLEEQVLIEMGNDKIQPINKEDINSTAYPVDEIQMTNKDFDAVPSVFSHIKMLILAVLGMFASVSIATKLISLFVKQKLNISSSDDKPPNKKTRSVSGGTKSCKHANGEFYCNQGGLVEMVCDSGPTEMSSSFNNSLSFSKQRNKIGSHDVTPSLEIIQRRESGVSSSISYGSFTSLERRSRKGNKQEEVMTPVRRSSRIRNKVSSP